MKKASEQAKTNMGSTYEKCPEMSHLMLGEGGPLSSNSKFSTYNQPKEPQNEVFNAQDNASFSSENHRKRQLKPRKGPDYRKINTYFKSTKQYWKERNRRKQAMLLQDKGFTHEQIAEKLGVSTKTVQRDLKKIKPYYERLLTNRIVKMRVEENQRLQVLLEGKSDIQKFRFLTDLMIKQHEMLRPRSYTRHVQYVIFDLDKLFHFRENPLTFKPKNPITLHFPHEIHYVLKSGEETQTLAVVTLSQKGGW